jgi:exopolysaccharide production protein ExoY
MERTQAIGIADQITEPRLGSSGQIAHPSEISSRATSSAIPLSPRSDDSPVQPTIAPTVDTIASPDNGRAFDIAVALLLLFFLLPLMCVCALAVVGTSRGPLLYRQPRIGRKGQSFECLKFRTMVQDADSAIERMLDDSPEAKAEWLAVQKIKCDPRVTPVGAFMRRYCLDELPQLFNVLRGEMSIVGPRPIVADEIDRFGSNFADYCLVKPGITGVWQVSGRHLLSYEQRVALDAEYARSKCISLDIKILWRTVPIVLLGENG